MRKLMYAVSLAFALGGLAPLAHAGEGCSYGHTTKKNDIETPPPAAATGTTKKQG